MVMGVALLVARVILAVVFGAAGVAKLADREGSRRALNGFGVPESLAAPLAWALPVLEVIIALALIPLDTAWMGAIGAAGLLLIFAVAIGLNVARGNSPDCHCFGKLHSEPVSWSVFVRNIVLAAVAGLIVVLGKEDPGLSAFAWLGEVKTIEAVSLTLSVIAAGLLVPIFALLRKALARQATMLETITAMKKLIEEDYGELDPVEHDEAELPIEGLPVGAPAPAFSLPTLAGNLVSLDDLISPGKSTLLLFVSPSCAPCKSLLPVVRTWERDYGDYLTFALLSHGSAKDVQAALARYEVRHLLLQGESTVADEYQAKWTPTAVLIAPDSKIASQVAVGDEAIRALVHHTVATAALPIAGDPAHLSGAARPRITVGRSLFKIGELAPKFSLPALNGNLVNSEDLLGNNVLLLFWDAQCPYCLAMFDDLQRWEASPPNGAPRLVYIASGNLEEARGKHQGLKSITLLDEDFDIGPLFGTNSTPAAVMIDAEGRIASSLAKGSRNILPLIGVRKIGLPIASVLARSAANGQMAQDSAAEVMKG
jgi:peroxiredoxin